MQSELGGHGQLAQDLACALHSMQSLSCGCLGATEVCPLTLVYPLQNSSREGQTYRLEAVDSPSVTSLPQSIRLILQIKHIKPQQAIAWNARIQPPKSWHWQFAAQRVRNPDDLIWAIAIAATSSIFWFWEVRCTCSLQTRSTTNYALTYSNSLQQHLDLYRDDV